MKTKPFFFSLPWMAAFGLVALECVSLMMGPGEERMKAEGRAELTVVYSR